MPKDSLLFLRGPALLPEPERLRLRHETITRDEQMRCVQAPEQATPPDLEASCRVDQARYPARKPGLGPIRLGGDAIGQPRRRAEGQARSVLELGIGDGALSCLPALLCIGDLFLERRSPARPPVSQH